MSNESTKPESINRLKRLKPNLEKRHQIINYIRSFFVEHNFLEIETPILIDSPLPEAHIESICAENKFLRTSHEPYLKACIAAGYEKIFEIGACFRKGEKGKYHREEFTMLEWYQVGATAEDLIPFTKKFLISIAEKLFGKSQISYLNINIDLSREWEIISLKEAFAKFAKHSIEDSLKKNSFELDLIESIEPKLPKNIPCIIKDYPAEFRAYANLNKNDERYADRWELYIAGLEIANTYSECISKDEIQKIMTEQNLKRKLLSMNEYKKCRIFDDAIDAGLPKCAGTALGVDRLVMLFTNSTNIEDVKI